MEDKVLADCYHHFYTTGEVTGPLFFEFDQRGRWMGRSQSTPAHLVKMLTMTVLSKPQMEEKGPKGKIILKTSFVDETSQLEANIKYHEVQGNIYINQARRLLLENLVECKNLYADRTQTIFAPSLEHVHRNFLGRDCKELTAPKLKRVGGSIHFDPLKELKLNKLEEVGADAIASGTKIAHLPNLKKVGKCLFMPQATKIHAPKLKEVKSLELTEMREQNLLELFNSLNNKTLGILLKNETEVGNARRDHIYKALQKELLIRALKQEDVDLEM